MDEKKQLFFSQRNKSVLLYNLNRDIGSRVGQLNKEQSVRLDRSLAHYMNEVYRAEGQNKPIALLNREVVGITQTDFDNYLRSPKKKAATVATPPAMTKPKVMGTPIDLVATEQPRTVMFQDTARTLDQIQKERAGNQPERPTIPDFRLNEDEDGPSPMELYEMAKKQRSAEEQAVAAARPPPGQLAETTNTEPNVIDILRSDDFIKGGAPNINSILPPPLETKRKGEPIMSVPPRVAAADLIVGPPRVGTNAQQTLIREENLLQYREIEQNLFISSADRNWVQDGQINMNRYNFTVSFDPGYTTQGPSLTPSSQKKFKNIVRVELVKFIVPKETLDVLLQRTSYSAGPPVGVYATNVQTNVLSFPSVVVQVSELDGNNYGTNDTVERSFGVIHYDAQWSSDPAGNSALAAASTATTTTGYVALIPKFIKCQKVYEPTPLATLQKLSIRLERPDNGELLSQTSDVLAVNSLRFSTGVATSIYQDAAGVNPAYIFIRTSTYFSRYMWENGDRIRFAVGVTPPGATSITTASSINDFVQWLNQEAGHLIVGIGLSAGGAPVVPPDLTTVTDGQNAVGYANVIIIQNRFTDPTIAGSVAPYDFGDEAAMNTAFATATYTGNTINLNHQVQAVFRIVTRELDPTTKIRPDNTF
jgi:hypothetical protein